MALRYLADKSCLTRMAKPAVGNRLQTLIHDDMIATCVMVDLELLYSARNPTEYEILFDERLGLEQVPITPDVLADALDIQRILARVGQHRRPIPDLIIAATARSANKTVLHYDRDFELIAEHVDLAHEWIVPRGTCD